MVEMATLTLPFSFKYMIWACILGGLAGSALPIGSLVGITWRPNSVITGAMAGFGAGALLAALSVELVAPTMMAAVEQGAAGTVIEPVVLILGCILGGILFVVLDQIINEHGGYLRKTATTIAYISHRKSYRAHKLLERLGHSEFFRAFPPGHVQILMNYLHPVQFESGQVIFREGDAGDRMYFIEDGEVQLLRGGEELHKLGAGEVLGEIAVVTGASRTAEARAQLKTNMLELTVHDFQRMRSKVPEVEEAAKRLAGQRLEELSQYDSRLGNEASQWSQQAAVALGQGREVPTPHEIKQAVEEHDGAPLAIWLGNVLDCIPESFVIGTSFLLILTAKQAISTPTFGDIVPYTLIAGLFLSNFPEAMSASVGMRNQGWKIPKTILMWVSLMVLTAVGAMIGYAVGADINPLLKTAMEGVAAGAMLTMVAQTMIPEAVHLGGSTVVGLSTLTGFLSAVAFKLLER